MRDRFARARERYQGEMVKLTREDLDRKIRYLERYEVSLLDLLSTHATHFAGHWYQTRYIRGCCSRHHDTDKMRFDPW